MLETRDVKKVTSATPYISRYKIKSYSKVTNVNVNIYPHILKQRAEVDKLEKKLVVDFDREFTGQFENQKQTLHRIFEKNTRIRKRALMSPGIGEKFDTIMHEMYLKEEDQLSDGTDDLFDLDYPIHDPVLESNKATQIESTKQVSKKHSSPVSANRQKYGSLIDTNTGFRATESNLEQEAVAAMRMGIFDSLVSLDLQGWVSDVLDNSITLDPVILNGVRDIDEKYGEQREIKEFPTETDISGFNVLFNACKPTILETRPAMRLNVVKEIGKRLDSAGSQRATLDEPQQETQRKKQYRTPWYVPVSQWQKANESISQQAHESTRETRRFGGVVQQKLDEIAKKREHEMSLLEEYGLTKRKSEARLLKK